MEGVLPLALGLGLPLEYILAVIFQLLERLHHLPVRARFLPEQQRLDRLLRHVPGLQRVLYGNERPVSRPGGACV